MNYIKLIRDFWVLQEENLFNTTDIALYFYLLEVCNNCNWKNPFKRNNARIMTDLGIKDRRTLDNSRNKLKLSGVIDFRKNATNPNVTYELCCAKNAQVGVQVPAQVDAQVGVQVPAQVDDTKDKLNQTKQNKTKKSKSHSEIEISVLEKIENLDLKNKNNPDSKTPEPGPEKNIIFKSLVAVWFEFYQSKFNTKPAFTSVDGGKLKALQGKLKTKSEEFQSEWTIHVAADAFRQFLIAAHNEKWLSEHFSLSNLDSQFNSIIVKIINGTVNKNSGNGNSAMATYKDQLINDLQGA